MGVCGPLASHDGSAVVMLLYELQSTFLNGGYIGEFIGEYCRAY